MKSRSRADLVAAPRHDGDVEVPLADAARLGAELPERLRDPPHQHDASARGEGQRERAQPRRPPRLRLDGRRVVALWHDDRREPLAVPDRKGRRPRQVALAAAHERVAGRDARAEVLHDLPDELRVLAGRQIGRVDAARGRDEASVAGGDQRPAAPRYVEPPDEARQALE
jgi:hypothetical protein